MQIKITKGLNDDAKKIRQIVFEDEQNFLEEFDDMEDVSYHSVIYVDNKAIATSRVFEKENGVFKLGRFAVLKEYRGNGYGKILVQEAEKLAMSLKAKSFELSAQVVAQKFYEKLGYIKTDSYYFEEHVEHVKMFKTIVYHFIFCYNIKR